MTRLKRFFKNLVGLLLDYGCCPNCGDYCNWKRHGNLRAHNKLNTMVCAECLKEPERLNTKKILTTLEKRWSVDDLRLAKKAIKKAISDASKK